MNVALALLFVGVGLYLYMHQAEAALPTDAMGLGLGALVPRASGGRLTPQQALDIINRVNASMGNWHDPRDVLAIIKIESDFDPNAYRAEPQIGDASYGLMQVLTGTAADMGYRGDPSGLFDPQTNIRVGMSYMRWIWDYLARELGRDPTEAEWISAYNNGVGNVRAGRLMLSYVSRFNQARENFAFA